MLQRWRALRAAHDILWGDPLSAAWAEDPRIQQLLPGLPNGVLRRSQDPYKATRVLQYTKEAVQDFLQHHGFTRVVRGHQGKGAGSWLIVVIIDRLHCMLPSGQRSFCCRPRYFFHICVTGVQMQHGARVITVFSDSRDHHHSSKEQQQLTNITLCGCLLIDSNVRVPPFSTQDVNPA
jgi:hypothetical protein